MSADVQFETTCSYKDATVRNFSEWLCAGNKADASSDNPLLAFSPEEFFCYADYKYMTDIMSHTLLDVRKSRILESSNRKKL